MGIKESIFALAGRVYFDKPGRKQTLAEHAAALRRSGDDLRARLDASGGDGLAERLRHVVGIERWGQARLRVLLGEPFVPGGHRPHLPPGGLSWEQLVREFATTRADTIAIAERLAAEDQTGAVHHNQFGHLSAHGWLRYLEGHARRELRTMR